MNIYSYRLDKKFPNVFNFDNIKPRDVLDLCKCPAFIIFHGDDDELANIYQNNMDHINKGLIAVIGISAGLLNRPANCTTNYLHCLTYSIKNNCTDDIIIAKFKTFINKINGLTAWPNSKDEMEKLWVMVDNNYKELDRKMLDELSPILIYGTEWNKNQDMVDLVKSYFGEPLLNYDELKNTLSEISKKIGLNLWINNIKRLNHNIFHHGFYHHFASHTLKKNLTEYVNMEKQYLDSDILAIFNSWESITLLFNSLYSAPEALDLLDSDPKRLFLDSAKSNLDWITIFITNSIKSRDYSKINCYSMTLVDAFLDQCGNFSKNLSAITRNIL